MTLDEARNAIGLKVLYRSGHTDREEGVINSVNDTFVFVRYGSQAGSQATRPVDLQLASGATL